MRTCIIYNPAAGSADRIEELRDALRGSKLIRAGAGDECATVAAQACDHGFDTIVAAGGDGTVNHVVNGLMSHGGNALDRPILGILPLGTGNDLARTLGISADDPLAAARQIREHARVQTLDLIKMHMADSWRHYGINVAAGGFTGLLNEVVSADLKKTWGPLAYLRGAIKVLPDLTDYRTTIRYDGSARQNIKAFNVIVANGQFAGGGIRVAPLADPEDALLDVIVINSGSVLELTALAAKLLTNGDYLNTRIVTHRRARRVAIDSRPGMWFNIDGELIGNEPVTFSVEPKALRVVVGSGYRADVQPVRAVSPRTQ